jgi:polar amino acid transport system ATP-binding protein
MKLKLSGLYRSFGGHQVLRDLSLVTGEIRTLALIGPSGGGKSTLLKILGGLLLPDSGEIIINGQKLERSEDRLRNYRQTVGTVFQAYNLFPHLTALENVILPLEQAHGLSKAAAHSEAVRCLKRFRLEEHLTKKPNQLSGGQRQRVAIARAIAIKPKLLFFDEPTSALDPEMTAEVLDVIEELKEEGRDLVIVTHAMAFARRVADEVALVAEGKIVEYGEAKSVLDQPTSEVGQRFLEKLLKYH